MSNKDYITVYWTSSAFVNTDAHWNFLYQDPVSVVSEFAKKRNKDVKQMFSCPAYVGSMKNVYSFNNLGLSKLALVELRESSLNDYVNVVYNMGWLLFADEPVEARFTAPYFPASAPANGVLLAPGQFNIGLWYRDFLLDYHIPFGTKQLVFNSEQPLFYLELRTEKKIVFKRYNLSPELKRIAEECSTSPGNYENAKPLDYRYSIFKKTASRERVLSYIKENLIE
jgi:hypothetical protein